MHSVVVQAAPAGAGDKNSNDIQTNSNWMALIQLPDGQTIPLFPQHRVRSPILSILTGLLPRGGESTVLELPQFSNSVGQEQSILLAWNELVAEHIMMEAQVIDIQSLLRLLMVRVLLSAVFRTGCS
jgi:hypothetical protein